MKAVLERRRAGRTTHALPAALHHRTARGAQVEFQGRLENISVLGLCAGFDRDPRGNVDLHGPIDVELEEQNRHVCRGYIAHFCSVPGGRYLVGVRFEEPQPQMLSGVPGARQLTLKVEGASGLVETLTESEPGFERL